MFEHLVVDDPQSFTPLAECDVGTLLAGQEGTADWLRQIGAPTASELISEVQKHAGREAFTRLATGSDLDTQKTALLQLKTPTAVQHLVAMLDAYDWEFVYQAQKLRGYAVAKILEDTNLPDPRHRLRALELLGKISEVGLFTERIEITKIDLTDEALEAKIKAKLHRFKSLISVEDVVDATSTVLPNEVSTNLDAPA